MDSELLSEALKRDLEAAHGKLKFPENAQIIQYFPSTKHTLFVMLPAAMPVACPHNVYFSRLTWAPDILGIGGVLFFADPFCYQPHSMAADRSSWFISQYATFCFKEMAKVISHVGRHYENITLYGSSMGGFAALHLGCLLNCTVIADCPQIFLDRHSAAKKVLTQLGLEKSFDPIDRMQSKVGSKFFILCSETDSHHLNSHINPAIELGIPAVVQIYCDEDRTGHIAIEKKELIHLFERVQMGQRPIISNAKVY